ncbi:hypothetical protein HYDPIDRAFT_34186 [Hydnomerulius pinastri MD-312]|uniref:Uncharacterized protein n=1 Tax=Hydnomerulius pinastri MD-312 TaxID=994086 RepID=A0A0C9W6N2_9AGAM|nr:hypothetical protein HYDPIDRAFT_34186 [Hydnomerulius pinastri MD-312]
MPPPENTLIDFEVPRELSVAEVSAKYPPNISRGQQFHQWDARAFAVVPPYMITSLNMDYVPSYIFRSAQLRARRDGCWGYVDPFQSPQDFADEFAWVPLIPKPGCLHDEELKDHKWVIWHMLTVADIFKENLDQDLNVGCLPEHFIGALQACAVFVTEKAEHFQTHRGRPSGACKTLIAAMQRHVRTLQQIPMFRRDIILVFADFQRCFLDLYAFLTFHLNGVKDRVVNLRNKWESWDVNKDWMGAFTDRASFAYTLFQAGVPVWFVHPESQIPKDIPTRTIHTGVAGQARAYLTRPAGSVETCNYSALIPRESLKQWITRTATSVPTTSAASVPDAPTVPSLGQPQAPLLGQVVPPLPRPPSLPMHPRCSGGGGVIKSMSKDAMTQLSQRLVGDLGKAISPSLSARLGRIEERLLLGKDARPPPPNVKGDSTWDDGSRESIEALHGSIEIPSSLAIPFLMWGFSGGREALSTLSHDTQPTGCSFALNGSRHITMVWSPTPPPKSGRKQYRELEWLTPPPFVPNAKLKGQEQHDNALKFLGSQAQQFQVLQHEVPASAHFHEHEIHMEDLHHLPQEITREITWEMNELGFRYELLGMDRMLMMGLRSNAAAAHARDQLVADVFHTSALHQVAVNALPDSSATGLAASRWKRRVDSVEALHVAISAWLECPVVLQQPVPSSREGDFEVIESIIIDFYLQSVFDMLGRRPTIPRVLPS